MSHTLTRPPDDRAMWRKLLAKTHPDTNGDHELFIWTSNVKELVCSDLSEVKPISPPPQSPQPEPPPADDCPRVPFVPGHDFEELTNHALRIAHSNEHSVYSYLLSLLADCRSLSRMAFEEQRGASYRRLAAIGHRIGMDLEERREWYSLADSIPLSDRHAGHILSRLKGRG